MTFFFLKYTSLYARTLARRTKKGTNKHKKWWLKLLSRNYCGVSPANHHNNYVRPYFRFRAINWVKNNGFSPNLVCTLKLEMFGLGLLMGKFRWFFTALSTRHTIVARCYHFTFLFLFERSWSDRITKTCLYNFDPLKSHFYIVKLGFTRVYIIFLISAQQHRLWVPVRTASVRRF